MLRIAFFDPVPWDYVVDTPRVKPLGGSQSALCYLAEELAKLGHAVTLYNHTKTPKESRGVTCRNFTCEPISEFSSYDAIIILNHGDKAFAEKVRSVGGKKTAVILWTQHNHDQPWIQDLADPASHDAWDYFVMVSDWQARCYRQAFGLKPERMKIIGNAIAPAFENLFAEPETIAAQKPWPPVLCYTSTPFRGLDVLIEAFPHIRKAFPGATLKVFSSMGVYGVPGSEDTYASLYARCRETEGVEYIGSVSQTALAGELKRTTCLAYPNTFAEGYCIVVHEAMAAGCIVITSDLGALRETTAGFAHLLAPPSDKVRHAELYADFAVSVLERARSAPAEHAERLRSQVRFVHQTETWAVRAREWHEWLSAIVARAENAAAPDLFTSALQHHLAGRLQEAEALYRQILEAQPANHAALHYLGLIAHQVGKHQFAVEYISRAIAIYPHEATYHNNLGEAYRVQGDVRKAAECFERATILNPDYADAHYNLGVVLQFQKKPEEAAASYRKTLSLQPDYSKAHNNLGNILREQGRVEDALVHYREALAADPVFIEAHNNLGAALQAQGKLDEAVACYRQALAIKPDFTEAYNNLGLVLQLQGNLEGAAAHYRQALAFKPDFAEGYRNLASVFQAQGNMEEAVEHYRKALQLRPAFPKAAKGLGFVLKLQGKLDEAIACYRRCLDVAPTDGMRILLGTSAPVIYRSKDQLLQARRTFQQQVAGLLREALSVTDPIMEVDATNFFLAYQGMNDLNLQMKVAQLYEQACPSLQYTADHCRSALPRPAGGKIKIGFISMYFTNHTVGQLMRGIMARLSRELFSVSALTFPHKPDWISGLIAREADHTIVLLPTSLDTVRRRIAEERFDILFYADIGMDPFTYYLAFSRLAPVQCTTWGHPVTTGIKTMDYFVSSKLIEPADAGRHYSERLIRLKQVPSYYYRPTIAGALKSRRELGVSESAHLYLCPQSLFKIHPDFDAFISGILQADLRGELILIDGTSMHWNTLLLERFRETIPHVVERIRFVPRMSGPDFLSLLSVADVILDPLHWSGGNTTYEALFFGTPVVTLPSKFMRGRVTGGFYRQMGVMDCVVATKAEYVKRAVRLGTDPKYREKIKAKILAANHVLYENMEVVREYERVFLQMVGGTQRK